MYDEGATAVIYAILVSCRFMLERSSNNYGEFVLLFFSGLLTHTKGFSYGIVCAGKLVEIIFYEKC